MNVYIPPIIEKVYNVQGSTAGAGSGEYHRYRAMRRRDRARMATMEIEYTARKKQKEFDETKERKRERIENERSKKQTRRMKKKAKKELLKKISSQGNFIKFDKNKPLVEQLKDEIDEAEFKRLTKEGANEFQEKSKFKIRRDKMINRDVQTQNNKSAKIKEEDNLDDKIKKLFPQIEKSLIQYETYDDYEESLEIKSFLDKIKKESVERAEEPIPQEPIKYKQLEENIIIHDYD
jgi:hypothetical protein